MGKTYRRDKDDYYDRPSRKTNKPKTDKRKPKTYYETEEEDFKEKKRLDKNGEDKCD